VYRIGDADVEAVLVLDLVVELLSQQDITEFSTYVEVVPWISTDNVVPESVIIFVVGFD
jgi:hypothetical protein